MPHAFARGQLLKELRVDCFVVNLEVGDAKVVEGCEHVVCQGVLKRDLKRNKVVELGKHVEAVGSRWCGGHAEIELRREVRHDLLVAVGTRAVGLVDDDVVEKV